jgi:hypothetical protein
MPPALSCDVAWSSILGLLTAELRRRHSSKADPSTGRSGLCRNTKRLISSREQRACRRRQIRYDRYCVKGCCYVGKAPLAVFPLYPVAALARTIGYSIEFMIHRSQHLDPFGRLYLTTELWMYFLPLAAIFVGCFELMMREKAGISRLHSDQVGLDR